MVPIRRCDGWWKHMPGNNDSNNAFWWGRQYGPHLLWFDSQNMIRIGIYAFLEQPGNESRTLDRLSNQEGAEPSARRKEDCDVNLPVSNRRCHRQWLVPGV